MSTTPASATPRRVALASLAGTTIEFYDFLIYGTAAALVFPKLFFPALGPAAGTVASFATFGVAFLARPLGGIVFGHYGDRIGRKRTLIVTLLLMGLSTVAIGLLPTAETIGVAAPILLILLRVLQGLAIGGEWAGAVLLTTEYTAQEKRGRAGMYPQLGTALAFSLTSATFLVISAFVDDASFLAYGWRIPFIASILLVAVGLYVRLNIEETPVFRQVQQRDRTADGFPFFAVLRTRSREVVVGGLCFVGTFSAFYLGTTFMTSYGVSVLTLPRPAVLATGVAAGGLLAAVIAGSALVSDRIGRKRVLAVANGAIVVAGLAVFPLVNTGSVWAFGLGLTMVLACFGVSWALGGTVLAELFETRYRYTGAGIAYNLAAIIGGALTPIFGTALLANVGSWAVGAMVSGFAVISLLALAALPETSGRDLDGADISTPAAVVKEPPIA